MNKDEFLEKYKPVVCDPAWITVHDAQASWGLSLSQVRRILTDMSDAGQLIKHENVLLGNKRKTGTAYEIVTPA